MLEFEIVFRVRSGRHQAPSILLQLVVDHVEFCAFFGIGESNVRGVDAAEAIRVAGFLVIWVKTLREEAIDAMNRVRLCGGVNLQHLVIVGRFPFPTLDSLSAVL